MKQHDEDEYVGFVHGNSHSLFRTAYLLTGDFGQAEDLVQATLMKVYQSWSRIAPMSQPGAYARRMLVNQAMSWWRRKSASELPVRVMDERGQAGHEDAVAESHAVWNAVLSLSSRQRAVIVLRYYEDLTEAETADVLGMALGTVKSHANAATHRLASLLDDSHALGTGGTPG